MNFTKRSDGSYLASFPVTAAELNAAIKSLNSTTPTSNGKGIYAFNAMSDPSLFVDNPNVIGVNLTRYWAELEPAKGQYNWSLIDNDIAPWAAAGKFVILRVSTAGWKSWQPDQHSEQGTPQWVFDLGVKSIKDPDGAIKPQYWNSLFLQNLSDFISVFGSQYDGNTNVFAIQLGIGDGGETKVSTNKSTSLSAWEGIGYSDAVWFSTIQSIVSYYRSSFPIKPLILMPDATFIGGTSGYNEAKLINYMVGLNDSHVWYQDNGLSATSRLPGSWVNVPSGKIISEQLVATSTSGDTLAGDLQNAVVNHKSQAVLIFSSDLQDTNNASILAQYATLLASS
jgi:hypothetical protein